MIEIRNVTKSYDGTRQVLNDLSLVIEEGEFVTILGPSGCGKTTLLKMVNKLIPYDKGMIAVNGRDLKRWNTTELRRGIGYVIQQIGLFPHMTIEDNIAYVMLLENVSKNQRHKRALDLIEMVGMSGDMLRRYPWELSGGQRQRIGVARAMAADPDIILMDEPFGAVDEIARTALQDELLVLQRQMKKTILFVTHDIEEALKMGSRIVLLNNGVIEQEGTKEALLFKPASSFVSQFFGIKGFKSILDERVIQEIYRKVLDDHKSLEDIYEKLEEL